MKAESGPGAKCGKPWPSEIGKLSDTGRQGRLQQGSGLLMTHRHGVATLALLSHEFSCQCPGLPTY